MDTYVKIALAHALMKRGKGDAFDLLSVLVSAAAKATALHSTAASNLTKQAQLQAMLLLLSATSCFCLGATAAAAACSKLANWLPS